MGNCLIMKIPFVTPRCAWGPEKWGWAAVSRIFTSNCQWSEPSTISHLPSGHPSQAAAL